MNLAGAVRTFLSYSGSEKHWHSLLSWSLRRAARERGYLPLLDSLRRIEPGIRAPKEDAEPWRAGHWELKRRVQHAFQCALMLKALERLPDRPITVVDIGASGTHLGYLRALAPGRAVRPIGVNLDPGAVAAMRGRGQEAVLCRGEELHRHLGAGAADLFLAFETIEHLHNPAAFFRNLAHHFSCRTMVVTTPYRRRSGVGLFHLRHGIARDLAAGEEHIFELCPGDWTLLMLHSGWRVVHGEVYRQYPVGWPLVRGLLARLWREAEFEGFWGAVLEKDTSFSGRYRDWE